VLIHTYLNSRPYLYHLTDRSNIDRMARTRRISPANTLFERAGRLDLVSRRRNEHERISIGRDMIVIRDQAPLHRGNLSLPSGYTFEEFTKSLNSRVFFWPGTAAGPIGYGIRHFERYKNENPAILRLTLASLLLANTLANATFCRYNSGSPRCSYGVRSPRGPQTFLPAAEFEGTPSQVVEVTFAIELALPADTEVGSHPSGPWRPLGT
jgi:hypothetical protein